MNDARVRTVARPGCPVCGGPGRVWHAALTDHWFGSDGTWTLRRCGARGCGSAWLDPAPHPDALAGLYAGYPTHAAAPTPLLGHGTLRAVRLAHLRDTLGYASAEAGNAALLRLLPGRREQLDLAVLGLRAEWRGPLLDVGCGAGALLELFATLGWQVHGLDPDPAAVAAVRARGFAAEVGTIDTLDGRDGHFAAVIATHVIEHVPDPRAFLVRAHTLARPGGRLALLTPNAASLGAALFGARWRGFEPPRHLQVLTARALARLAAEAGWRDVQVRGSARLAGMIARESVLPTLAREHGAARAGLLLRAAAAMFQWLERALVPAGWGEELWLTAKKAEDA